MTTGTAFDHCWVHVQVYGSFHQTPEGDMELPLLDSDKVERDREGGREGES